MTHFTREQTDSEWYLGRTSNLATYVRNIDEKTTKVLNDSTGTATWSPSSAIAIGGEGIQLMCPMYVNCTSFGGYQISPGTGKYIKFGDDDYFQFYTGIHERIIQQDPALGVGEGFDPHNARYGGPIVLTRKLASVVIPLIKLPNGQKLKAIDVYISASSRGRLLRHLKNGTVSPIVVPGSTDLDGWGLYASTAVGVDLTSLPGNGHVVDISAAEYFFEVQSLTTAATEVRYVEMKVWYSDMRPT